MYQQVYWSAALWEVLLITLTGLTLLGVLLIRVLRRPNLSSALEAVDSVLAEQPLFFFNKLRGVQPLNQAAEQVLTGLPAAKAQFLLNVLTDAASEALTEERQTMHKGWPQAKQTLLAVPLFSTSAEEIRGALVTVVRGEDVPYEAIESLPQALSSSLPLTAAPINWIQVGPQLAVHPEQPIVHVQRNSLANGENFTKQEQSLTHLEDMLLRFLLMHKDEVQTAERLFQAIWPNEEVDPIGLRPDQKDRLRRLVYQLRKKAEPAPRDPQHLQTAHGVGYALYSGDMSGSEE